jgi:hypothetical protein
MLGSVRLLDLPSGWLSISWMSLLVIVLVTMIVFLGVLSCAIKAQLSEVKWGVKHSERSESGCQGEKKGLGAWRAAECRE